MRILEEKSSFNFYESFSDLIFCTLVLFLVLVLFLALNVNRKVEDIRQAEEEVEVRKVQIQEMTESLKIEEHQITIRKKAAQKDENDLETRTIAISAERRELEAARASIDQANASIHDAQNRIDRLLGTRRFTGKRGLISFLFAVDWRTRDKQIYFLPAELRLNLKTSENDLEFQREVARSLHRYFRDNQPFTIPEVVEVYLNISPYWNTSEEIIPGVRLGVVYGKDFVIRRVLPTSAAKRLHLVPGDRVVAIEGQPVPVGDVNLETALATYSVGDRCVVTIARGERMIDKTIRFIVSDMVFSNVRLPTLSHSSEVSLMASGAVDDTFSPVVSDANIRRLMANFEDNNSILGITQDALQAAFRRGRMDFDNDGSGISSTLPVLKFGKGESEGRVRIGSVNISFAQMRAVILAFGGGIIVEYVPSEEESDDIPEWVTSEILLPTGLVNKAPDLSLADQFDTPDSTDQAED